MRNVRVEIRPDIDVQRAYYDDRWARETYANLLQLQRAIAILDGLRMLGLRSPRILDLGCGTGWLTAILGCFGPATGIDLSPLAIQKAQACYPDIRFIAADLSSMGTTDETFDVVVSQEVIEHVENQSRYLDLVSRFLRPGGYLILTTPNAWNLAHWTEDSIKDWGLQPVEQWLTRRQLRSLLQSQFKVIHLRTIILGYGTQGVFRVVNSTKLATILKLLGLFPLYESVLERLGFGLHIFVIAQRR